MLDLKTNAAIVRFQSELIYNLDDSVDAYFTSLDCMSFANGLKHNVIKVTHYKFKCFTIIIEIGHTSITIWELDDVSQLVKPLRTLPYFCFKNRTSLMMKVAIALSNAIDYQIQNEV